MRIVSFIFVLLVSVPLSFSQRTGVVVVIDPGHGGNDPGHLSQNKNHLTEKELNLKISKFLGSYLETYLQNVTVLYTRTGDTYPSLDERVDKANNNNADYFISVHCNGNDRSSVRGTETHVHSMELKKSVNLAKSIEKQFSARAGRKSRGIKDERDLQHSLQVLKFTNMTSVLVECGFLTNEREANFLNTTYGQEIIASAIFRGFRATIEAEHPSISFRKEAGSSTVAQTSSEAGGSYCIQIASSKAPIDTDDSYFKKAKMAVLRKELNTTSAYKYIYTIGNYSSKSDANETLKKIKELGFKDAIVIKG